MLLARGNPKKAKCRYSVRTNLKRKNEMNLSACLLVHKEICDELKKSKFPVVHGNIILKERVIKQISR
jgi:hypothetical protein